MKRRAIPATEASDLRQVLQVAVLESLMASRRWEPFELIFQGGTSLHLVYGSARASEDLDFLVDSSVKLDSIGASVGARLRGAPWVPKDGSLSVTPARDGHNPHAFSVVIGGRSLIGSVRVKVELWQTAADAMAPMKVAVAPVRIASGSGAGAQAFVPTAELSELFVDKVFALGARPYLKPRDVFDLHWLAGRLPGALCTVDSMRLRLATYPTETPSAWLERAFRRRAELPKSAASIGADLRNWLPSSWPLGATAVTEMVASAVRALDHGIEPMRAIDGEP